MKTLHLNVFLHMQADKILIGKLAQEERRIYFEYDPDFITLGIELSPFKLPVKPGAQVEKDQVFSGLFGLFNDSLPDGWGLLLMDRYFRKNDIEPLSISPLERLAYMGGRALGALSYEPCHEIDYQWQSNLTFEILAADCEKILHGKEDDILAELIIAGGSPGGARPKVVVGYDEKTQELYSGIEKLPKSFRSYLVKFPTMIDTYDLAEIEHAYALMAKDAGINIPNTRLFNAGRFGKAFGIERFDKHFNERIHMHTLSGLLHADHRLPSLDYIDFLKATWLLTQDRNAVIEAFRRMVFNVLTHNRDDHAKNFSYLLVNNQWTLSPAYDLTYSSGVAGEHTMTIAGEGANPRQEHLLKVAKELDLNQEHAQQIIEQVKTVVAHWQDYAKQAQLNKKITNSIQKVFANITL